MEFRKLRADEIECRVAQKSDKTGSLSLLLYKDARCDQRILDEVFGIFGWKKEYREIKGNLFCTLLIKSPDGEWIGKEDVGTESYTESQKGEASDAFKRACFNWGIGRELYTAPSIWISASDYNPGGKSTYDRFAVTDIAYDDKGRICKVTIKNLNMSKVVFSWKSGEPESKPEVDENTKKIAEQKIDAKKVKALESRIESDGIDIDKLLKLYKVKSISDLNEMQLSQIVNTWSTEIIPKCKA